MESKCQCWWEKYLKSNNRVGLNNRVVRNFAKIRIAYRQFLEGIYQFFAKNTLFLKRWSPNVSVGGKKYLKSNNRVGLNNRVGRSFAKIRIAYRQFLKGIYQFFANNTLFLKRWIYKIMKN